MALETPLRSVVIDMGSNSFRLVAYDYVPERWWRRSDEIYDGVRIGAGLLAHGTLAPERMGRALEVMDVYAHFCLASGIPLSEVTPVATSAIREAANGADFVASVKALKPRNGNADNFVPIATPADSPRRIALNAPPRTSQHCRK